MIHQWAGPPNITVRITASSLDQKAEKHVNAFRSLLRKQKVKAVCTSYGFDGGLSPVWKIEFDLDKMHSLQPYSQHVYYRKIYIFNLKETVQTRPVVRAF